MNFTPPLIKGKLLKRYKRFMADIQLEDGTTITAHCANTGAMLGLTAPSSAVWVSYEDNPKRKLKYTWHLIQADNTLIGINTQHPNTLVAAGIEAGVIDKLRGYPTLSREVKYGTNSRIDILLQAPERADCYVEVKNVHLVREKGLVEFPDSVTARGTKHLVEMSKLVASGKRAVMVYLIQRIDCDRFQIAHDIDPEYGKAFTHATNAGVEVIAYSCKVTESFIKLSRSITLNI